MIIQKAIRHEKLNQPTNPCDPSPDYNFGRCVEEYVVKHVGCQPPWRRFNFSGVPECDSWPLLYEYGKKSAFIAETEGGEVTKKTKCLLPCSFMEYKVHIKLSACHFQVYCFFYFTFIVFLMTVRPFNY